MVKMDEFGLNEKKLYFANKLASEKKKKMQYLTPS